MKAIPSLFLPLLAGAALLLAGCGKSEAPAASDPAAAQAPAVDGVKSVTITADDTMKFNVTEIRAQAGEKVRVTFRNLGRMPKQAI
jgi:azurin